MECRETHGQLGNVLEHNLLFWKLDDRRREDGISRQTWFQEKVFISMGKNESIYSSRGKRENSGRLETQVEGDN